MPTKKYLVDLTDQEQTSLLALVRTGRTAARSVRRANILLAAAAGSTDEQIAATFHVGTATIERTRRRFVEEGLDQTLYERTRSGRPPTMDSAQEAQLVALACSAPPDERVHWTMQLLADRLVELQIVPQISDETVRRTLKKTF